MEKGQELVIPINMKEIRIYHRTKKRRIKKKQMKKAPIIEVHNQILKYVGLAKNIKKFEIYVDGKKIESEGE